MIDLHSHILPGLDDGPKAPAESIALAKAYQSAGFSAIVATPHWIYGTSWMPAAETVLQKVDSVNRAIKKAGLSIIIHAGMEIALGYEIVDLIGDGRILSLAGGPYLLLETPFRQFPPGWEQILFSISTKGYKIIMAHPERSEQLINDPGVLKAVLAAGAYLQINGPSLVGGYGKHIQQAALYLIQNGLAHCLATDSHDTGQRCPDHFAAAVKYTIEIIGEQNADLLTRWNPRCVLSGEEMITPVVPERLKAKQKRRFL
jgi:protein-tyrosine phosphatase